ncbi:hypothetical protein ABZY20_15545 [Streptomyces sp. NPDC006624]|uniref:hypothetical protein n=1 Tax=Streptomyces sp. NPDC006624 TaxID=3154892 RepID=UPI0033AF99AB
MKPLGFTQDEMRSLLAATGRLDSGAGLPPGEREELRGRVRGCEEGAQRRVSGLCTRLVRAEEFARRHRVSVSGRDAAPDFLAIRFT